MVKPGLPGAGGGPFSGSVSARGLAEGDGGFCASGEADASHLTFSMMMKMCLPTLVCLACAGLMVGGKAATKMKGRPLVAHIGKGIGAYTVGMPLAEARLRSGAGLKPEGVSRLGKTGWLAGPLLLIVDDESQKIDNDPPSFGAKRWLRLRAATETQRQLISIVLLLANTSSSSAC
ncbi:MAG: hypothetical protein AAF605_06530 [Myxococcota bacterium]